MEKKDETKNGQKYNKNAVNENKNGNKKSKWYIWPIKITLITFILSAFFSLGTEIVTSKTGIIIASAVLVILVAISIIFDAVGVAVTACDLSPLTAMAAKKVRGSKHAIMMVKNANKVASLCSDVIGDICGIVSGACGAAIAIMIVLSLGSNQLLISIIISAVLASMTVGGKSIMKTVAINNSTSIVLYVGKLMSVFKSEGKR
ncbi:MAG: hypothetical protein EOM87_09405 [Clostridia bacterium]|nr:hypothetical protein [Clostridia bacterium]